MKHLIKRVRKFLAPSPEMDVKYLREKIQRLENDLAMFDYNWYEMHLKKGECSTTLDMIRDQARFHIINHIELLRKARIYRLKKRLIAFVLSINIILLISLLF